MLCFVIQKEGRDIQEKDSLDLHYVWSAVGPTRTA